MSKAPLLMSKGGAAEVESREGPAKAPRVPPFHNRGPAPCGTQRGPCRALQGVVGRSLLGKGGHCRHRASIQRTWSVATQPGQTSGRPQGLITQLCSYCWGSELPSPQKWRRGKEQKHWLPGGAGFKSSLQAGWSLRSKSHYSLTQTPSPSSTPPQPHVCTLVLRTSHSGGQPSCTVLTVPLRGH
jgi:hypothetical protein